MNDRYNNNNKIIIAAGPSLSTVCMAKAFHGLPYRLQSQTLGGSTYRNLWFPGMQYQFRRSELGQVGPFPPRSELVSTAKNREHGLRSYSAPCAGPDPCRVISSDSITSQ